MSVIEFRSRALREADAATNAAANPPKQTLTVEPSAQIWACCKCDSEKFTLWCSGDVECLGCNMVIPNVRTFQP